MSISQLFPEEGPTLNLNFAGSRTLDPRITFSRTTTGTYVGSDGFIKVAPADSPRFDHRYVNGEIESLGLLVEEQRENLLLQSEDFSTTWSESNASVSANQTIAPDGNATADKLVCGTGTPLFQGIQQSITATASATRFSVYVKAAELDQVELRSFTPTDLAIFELSTQQVLFQSGSPAPTITDAGNGWYRCSITSSSSGVTSFRISLVSGGSRTFTPILGAGVYLWGAQLEEGSFPTSYIPTSGSTATRNPDNVRMEGENFSDWYNQSEGTVFVEASYKNTSGSPIYLRTQISGDATTRTDYYIQANNTRAVTFFGINNVPQASIGASVGSWPIDSIKKVATSYANDNFNQAVQGQLSNSDTSGNVPQGQNLAIIGLNFNGTIRVLIYYPTRLPNVQLISLTR